MRNYEFRGINMFKKLLFLISAVLPSFASADGRVSMIIPENIPYALSLISNGEANLTLQRDIQGYAGTQAMTFPKPVIRLSDSTFLFSRSYGDHFDTAHDCYDRFLNNAINNRDKIGKIPKLFFVLTFSRAEFETLSDSTRLGILRIDSQSDGLGSTTAYVDCTITNSANEAAKVAATRFVTN
jgi:hypothetical protein